jgi:hypothetical protein
MVSQQSLSEKAARRNTAEFSHPTSSVETHHSGLNESTQLLQKESQMISEAGSKGLTQPWLPASAHSRKNKHKVKPVSISSSVFNEVNNTYPVFFVLRSNDGTKSADLDIFNVQKDIERIAGQGNTQISELSNGDLLVKALSKSASQAISKLSSIANTSIQSSPHKRLNSSQGTIFCKKLMKYSVERLAEELASQHVVNVHRFRYKENGVLMDSARLLLTFDTPHPPSELKAGYLTLSVRQFIPNPRRCFNCQRYGHPSKFCKSTTPVCGNCGQHGHSDVPPCQNPTRCFHCRQSHKTSNTSCPAYTFEKEVLAVNAKEKLGLRAARQHVAARFPGEGLSYSQILKTVRPTSRQTGPTVKQPQFASTTFSVRNGSDASNKTLALAKSLPPNSLSSSSQKSGARPKSKSTTPYFIKDAPRMSSSNLIYIEPIASSSPNNADNVSQRKPKQQLSGKRSLHSPEPSPLDLKRTDHNRSRSNSPLRNASRVPLGETVTLTKGEPPPKDSLDSQPISSKPKSLIYDYHLPPGMDSQEVLSITSDLPDSDMDT